MRDWRKDAACLGEPLEIFFPDGNCDDKWDQALAVCNRCHVRMECLSLVMDLDNFSDRYGMFGGLTPSERANARRLNARTACSTNLRGGINQ